MITDKKVKLTVKFSTLHFESNIVMFIGEPKHCVQQVRVKNLKLKHAVTHFQPHF